MSTKSILLAAAVLTMSLTPIISGQASASEKIYDWTTIAGTVTNSGSADGTNSAARFYQPQGVAVDANGNLYVGDWANSTIRKIAPVGTNLSAVADWVTSTIAGSAGNQGSADGTNNVARFDRPYGVTVDTNGNLYVADTFKRTIRKVTPVVGTTNWVTTTIAGLADVQGHADGTNSDAQFNYPTGVGMDTNGNLYVADSLNNTIRKIAPVGTNWVTTTIAGLALNHGTADGTNSDARFYYPAGSVAVDTNGNLYVADQFNHIIRKVTPVGTNWIVSTIAGLAGANGSTDGTNSNARFQYPTYTALDSVGNVYVADSDNHTIRKLVPVGTNWVVSTIGGLGGNDGSAADGLNNHARFNSPYGVAVDGSGNVYVADSFNDTIRLGVPLDILTITKETAKLNFAKTNSDSCTLTATLDLGAGYNLTNKPVSLDIGGADASFTLDAKGKGRGVGTYGTCKLTYKKKTGPWTFAATLKKGSWATQWETYGFSNSTTTVKAGVPVTLPVVLEIGDETFAGEKTLLYKAKAGKSGSAK
jgi:streptogramin lyase